jgi:hypothetical protein
MPVHKAYFHYEYSEEIEELRGHHSKLFEMLKIKYKNWDKFSSKKMKIGILNSYYL